MKIVAGRWRGRSLVAPPGITTRPTAERLRQAMFDMLWHAPWGGRALLEGAAVVDLFAGTGALGLEALSRGAATCEFHETDAAALRALRANIAACGAGGSATVHPRDACRPVPGPVAALVFADPPYHTHLAAASLAAWAAAGRIGPATVLVCELAVSDPAPAWHEVLAERAQGAGRVLFARGAIDARPAARKS